MPTSNAIEAVTAGGPSGVPAAVAGPSTLQVVTLGLGQETFALDADYVQEVLDQVPITEVPNSRSFVKGLINVRGKVVPVVDLRCKFGMTPTEMTRDSRIVVLLVPLDGEPTLVGALADRVYEVTELAQASMEEAPRLGMRWRAEYIRAIGKRDDTFLIVMDIERVFATDAATRDAEPDDPPAGRKRP